MTRALATGLFCAAVASTLVAGTKIVLEDGQVLEGVDVRRDGDLYVVELESGGVLTLPVDLVAEVRLSADGDDATAPPGLTYSAPRQLAGQPVGPLRPSEAQAVLGEPSKFQPNIIDPNWEPESGFPEGDVLANSRSTWQDDIIDPSWEPESGFPEESVLADSRSTWQRSIIDNTWVPEDGFKKKKTSWEMAGRMLASSRVRLTGARTLAPSPTPARMAAAEDPWYAGFPASRSRARVQFRFRIPSGARAPATAVRACARHVLQASDTSDRAWPIAVSALDETRYASLPIDLYRVTGDAGGGPSRAVFTLAGGTCRAVSGDLRDPLGVELTRSYTMTRGVEAYDEALGEDGGIRLGTKEDKVDYALAVVSLIDPDISGRREASLVLLEDAEDLTALAAGLPEQCAVSGAKRKKAVRKALRKVAAPRVVVEGGRERVELFTWSSSDGEVVRHTVLLAADGRVSVSREAVGSHVGAHRDRDEE